MAIIDHLLAALDIDAPVRSLLVGAHLTVVCSRRCGLAARLPDDGTGSRAADQAVARLSGRSARELAEGARSDDPTMASIGVAALNSLLDVDERRAVEVNAVEVLIEQGRGKRVALVGHFPFVPKIREVVEQLWVLERRPQEGDYPAEAAGDLIPRADVVAITASTLVNRTLDGVLSLCQPGALVMLLGPSTPLSTVLFDDGISVLSGAQVVDESAVLRTVERGRSFREAAGVRLLTLWRDPPPAGTWDSKS